METETVMGWILFTLWGVWAIYVILGEDWSDEP